MLTIQILTRNNEKHIKRCIDSLSPLQAKIQIADLQSTDRTCEICKGCEILRVEPDLDRSKIRNALLKLTKTEWLMYIEPYEALVSGHEDLLKACKGNLSAYYLRILRNDILTKEIRLWRKDSNLCFRRPVYEGIEAPASVLSSLICGEIKLSSNLLKSLKEWQEKEPTSPEPIYYLALTYLALGNYQNFITAAEHYLFQAKKEDDSTILLKYYLALTEIKVFGNHEKGAKNLLSCLALKPLNAEFWCLLGDLFLARSDLKRAKIFYNHALFFGKERNLDDDFFVEISKYEDYPKSLLVRLNNL